MKPINPAKKDSLYRIMELSPPDTKEILRPFEGVRLANGLEFLCKKMTYSLQHEYGNFYGSGALFPQDLGATPKYIIFHSTDGEQVQNRPDTAYGETFFLSTLDRLQKENGWGPETRRISASVARRDKLGEELSAEALRDKLTEFVRDPVPHTTAPASREADTNVRRSPIRQGCCITVGVTGASGAIYAQTILRVLDADSRVAHVYLVASDAGLRLIATELGIVAPDAKKLASLLTGTAAKKLECLPNKDIGASIASGSAAVDAMVVIPCSAGALASIASGVSDDLLTRAADVCLKERRKLIVCLRETPLNRIHIENMLRLHDAGALVMPATPAFYYEPKSIDDVVTQYVYRVLAHLDLPQDDQYHWQGGKHGK